jgi:hypothetical protein
MLGNVSQGEQCDFLVAEFQLAVIAHDITQRGKRVPEGVHCFRASNPGGPSVLAMVVRPPPVAVIPGSKRDAVVAVILRAFDLIRLAAQPGKHILEAERYHS